MRQRQQTRQDATYRSRKSVQTTGAGSIETHDHDTYTGHFPLRLRKFTPTCLAFEIARATHNYVEVTYELDAKRFDDVQRIVHIIFGLQR